MKSSIAAAGTLVLAFATLTAPSFGKEGKKAGTVVLTPASDLKWNDVPGFPGVKMAVLQGDPAKGPHHSMIKFDGGFAAPLHHHSSDHYVTVVSGTLVLTVDGKETRLPAGSFFLFKGKMRHMTRAEAGSDCLLSLDVRGKWDVIPEAGGVTAKK